MATKTIGSGQVGRSVRRLEGAAKVAGRAEYVRCQKAIGTRAEPLRAALLAWCDLLLQAAGCR